MNRNASEEVANATLTDTHRGVGIIVDNSDGDEGDPTHPRGRKRRISDKENGERKKTKVSMPMLMINSLHNFVQKGMDLRIKIQAGGKRSTVKISVKIT